MTFPSPLQLLDAKRAGRIPTITIPSGPITLASYLHSWKRLLKLPPDTDVENWEWFSCSAADILNKIRNGIHDRINRHLPWFPVAYRYHHTNDPHARRIHTKLARLVATGKLRCECRWCGTELPHYQNRNHRFCGDSCRHDYHS